MASNPISTLQELAAFIHVTPPAYNYMQVGNESTPNKVGFVCTISFLGYTYADTEAAPNKRDTQLRAVDHVLQKLPEPRFPNNLLPSFRDNKFVYTLECPQWQGRPATMFESDVCSKQDQAKRSLMRRLVDFYLQPAGQPQPTQQPTQQQSPQMQSSPHQTHQAQPQQQQASAQQQQQPQQQQPQQPPQQQQSQQQQQPQQQQPQQPEQQPSPRLIHQLKTMLSNWQKSNIPQLSQVFNLPPDDDNGLWVRMMPLAFLEVSFFQSSAHEDIVLEYCGVNKAQFDSLRSLGESVINSAVHAYLFEFVGGGRSESGVLNRLRDSLISVDSRSRYLKGLGLDQILIGRDISQTITDKMRADAFVLLVGVLFVSKRDRVYDILSQCLSRNTFNEQSGLFVVNL